MTWDSVALTVGRVLADTWAKDNGTNQSQHTAYAMHDGRTSKVVASRPKNCAWKEPRNRFRLPRRPTTPPFHCKAIRKFEWDDGGACKYVEVEKFCDDDLLDPDVYFRQIPCCDEDDYIASLEDYAK